MPLQKLSFQTFAGQVDTTFDVRTEDGVVVPVRLLEAKRFQRRMKSDQGTEFDSFSLLFAGPLEPVLPQRIYEFGHSKIGRFEMFMVPVVSRDTTCIHYECIFNRPAVRHG